MEKLQTDPARKALGLPRAGNNYEKLENWAKAAECFETSAECQTDPAHKAQAFTRACACRAQNGEMDRAHELFDAAMKSALSDEQKQIISETWAKYGNGAARTGLRRRTAGFLRFPISSQAMQKTVAFLRRHTL